MIEKDNGNKQKQADFMRLHTLTPEDRRKLIEAKLVRAQVYHEAWKKREALLEESR